METKRRMTAVDILLLIATVLPLFSCLVLQILCKPAPEGITVNGAYIYLSIPMPLQPLLITEVHLTSWAVILTILFLCLFLTHRMSVRHPSARQHLAEWIVQTVDKLVLENMGDYFRAYAPFVTAIIGLSAFSSLSSLLGLFPPTTDLNIVAGWAILVFFMITYYKLKCGPLHYAKELCEPVFFLAPINVIGEVATPISMSFRHYGNVLSGVVVSVLVGSALETASSMLFAWLPGVLGDIPFLRIGLPAVLSIYFDLFSGCMQAFIFAMLTMLYISGAFPMEDYFARRAKIEAKKKSKRGGN